MTLDELADLGRELRQAQKRRDRDGGGESLFAAREMEARFDRVLKALAEPPAAPGLFDGPTPLTPEHPDKP